MVKNERKPKNLKIWKDEKCENLANPKIPKMEKTKMVKNGRKPEISKIWKDEKC